MTLSPAAWEKVLPEEESFCEWCGHYFEWCTCWDDLKFEEEEEGL